MSSMSVTKNTKKDNFFSLVRDDHGEVSVHHIFLSFSLSPVSRHFICKQLSSLEVS